MTVLELVTALRQYNVAPRLEGETIKLTGNTKALPPALLEAIKVHKEQVIAFLKASCDTLAAEPIPVAPQRPFYPLSNAQKRIWVLSQFQGGNQTYNITNGFYLEGHVQAAQLEEAFQRSIALPNSVHARRFGSGRAAGG